MSESAAVPARSACSPRHVRRRRRGRRGRHHRLRRQGRRLRHLLRRRHGHAVHHRRRVPERRHRRRRRRRHPARVPSGRRRNADHDRARGRRRTADRRRAAEGVERARVRARRAHSAELTRRPSAPTGTTPSRTGCSHESLPSLPRLTAVEIDPALAAPLATRPGAWFAGSDSMTSLLFRLIHVRDTLVPVDPDRLPAGLAAAGFTGVRVARHGRAFRFRARRAGG